MKKIKLFLLFLSSVFVFSACSYFSSGEDISSQDNIPTVLAGKYTGSKYKGNYIYAGAMNLAWNDLIDSITHEKIQLNTDDAKASKTADALNNPVFSKKDIDAESYYIKAGYGQKTLETINKEVQARFPEKTFPRIDFQLQNEDIIVYAYLLKAVEFMNPFQDGKVEFEGIQVNGFQAATLQQKKNVSIVDYWNDDKFIIRLTLKDNSDQLFLAKGFEMDTPEKVVAAINKHTEYPQTAMEDFEPGRVPLPQLKITPEEYENLTQEQLKERTNRFFVPLSLNEHDIFQAPSLNLDYHREFEEMIGKSLANKNFEKYVIAVMFENIRFMIDAKGAKVENEAVIGLPSGIKSEPVNKIKRFVLDKPFWVIMKKTVSPNPYFMIGITNTELMEKSAK